MGRPRQARAGRIGQGNGGRVPEGRGVPSACTPALRARGRWLARAPRAEPGCRTPLCGSLDAMRPCGTSPATGPRQVLPAFAGPTQFVNLREPLRRVPPIHRRPRRLGPRIRTEVRSPGRGSALFRWMRGVRRGTSRAGGARRPRVFRRGAEPAFGSNPCRGSSAEGRDLGVPGPTPRASSDVSIAQRDRRDAAGGLLRRATTRVGRRVARVVPSGGISRLRVPAESARRAVRSPQPAGEDPTERPTPWPVRSPSPPPGRFGAPPCSSHACSGSGPDGTGRLGLRMARSRSTRPAPPGRDAARARLPVSRSRSRAPGATG